MTYPVRVGAVSYLNTKPLIEGLDQVASISLSVDLPSRLAEQLAEGEIDVGLIPVVELFRGENYSYIPGISISSFGPVLSVTLFSRKPWPAIKSVSLDVGSRTSAALVHIIARERYHLELSSEILPLEADPNALTTDAVLLIGDRAMKASMPEFPYAYDLGQEWSEWTGLPMVFAVWAVRPGLELSDLPELLHEAKRLGLSHTGQLAEREAKKLQLDAGYCRRYFSNIIRYDLGPQELAGMKTYYNFAAQLGLVPSGVCCEPYRSAYSCPIA